MFINVLEQNTVSVGFVGFFLFVFPRRNFKSRKYRSAVETKLLCVCVCVYYTNHDV